MIFGGYLQVDGATEDAAAASTSGRSVAQRVSALEWRTEQVRSRCIHAGRCPCDFVHSSVCNWHLEVRHCPGSNSMHSGQPPGDLSRAAGPLRAGRCAGDGWPS
jgi:hypothetical protein